MTFAADQIIDRRRLRRKLSFWRVIAFVALVLAIIGGYAFFVGRDGIPEFASPQIARVTVSGFITDDRARNELLDKLAKTDAVKAVVVSIDSTGGATAGGEALYEGLRRLTEAKPTVATVGTFAASAAYMAAIATDHIVTRRTSITGSIGVLFQYPEVSELMKKVGVALEEVKSSPLKAEPSPFKPPSPEATAVIAGVVRDTYEWFVDIVAERRALPRATAVRLADGRIFTGRQALDAKLVDEIGGEGEAIAWLAKEHGVDANLPIKDWEPESPGSGFFSYADALVLWFAQKTGISQDLLRGGILDRFLSDRLTLDGLLSVWQGRLGGDAGPAKGAAP
jgi:protease IV